MELASVQIGTQPEKDVRETSRDPDTSAQLLKSHIKKNNSDDRSARIHFVYGLMC